jgi:hypothetical protein
MVVPQVNSGTVSVKETLIFSDVVKVDVLLLGGTKACELVLKANGLLLSATIAADGVKLLL